ncbi:hypothetical protein EUX98_g4748 [Antrodiella citrinella]|uniref:Uncharacterized protein n=1 Tax=Antrodiella citrinella TaxID=2447956 RepID=A0A4S4N158_9APHY|nr:hypothetical protein EUX98_g4748 [Antrodiella citrinella]
MTRRGGSNMAASPSVYRDARQYHHFVPCFIVRNWQVPQGASDGPSTSSGGTQATRIRESRKARGERRLAESVQRRQALAEECIKMYDVQASTLHLCTPLNRAYDIFDMYKDESGGQPNVYHVEMLFSKLESQAARILREIQRSIIDTNTPPRALTPVTLSRVDVNTLRKFLFLLEYRSPACSN